MQTAISERLTDLISVAELLKTVIDAETPEKLLPTFPLCRVALLVDSTVGQLETLAEQLSGPRVHSP